MWTELGNLGLVKVNNSSPLQFFSTDHLNSFYAELSSTVSQLTFAEYSSAVAEIRCQGPVFHFNEVSENLLTDLLNSLTSNSLNLGPDNISLYCIHKAQTSVISHLTSLFNYSLRHSYFPDAWKQAYIRPLSKIKTPKNPSDTRPIANLSELSKVLERVVHKQITNFIDTNSILDERQSGYRSGYSTQTALVRVLDDVRLAIDNKELTLLVLFDFSKAFDTIPHLSLLCKLKSLGLSEQALGWFFSYLTGRTQAVVDEKGNCSRWLPTNLGVPQGSVLAPLLFSLYVNDIGKNLRYSQYMVFADDTQIYLRCSPQNLNHGLAKLSHDVQVISQFATSNGLRLNIGKSKIMILGSKPFTSAIDLSSVLQLSINGIALPFVTEAKNLGIEIQSNLSWHRQVSLISRKIYGTLHQLKYHKASLSTDLRINLVTTLIFPHFDYCCLVFCDLTDELNNKLQRLMNTCIRFIFDIRRVEHITPYRNRLRWLSIRNRRLYFLGIAVYRVLHLPTPQYIRELFSEPDEALRRSTRLEPSIFHIPAFRTEVYRNSFSLSAVYFWQGLPRSVKTATSLTIFKTRIFDYLLLSEG